MKTAKRPGAPKRCFNDTPRYLASAPVLRAWVEGWTNPSREEQDRLAEDIRVARVAARAAVTLAGGVGLAAYVAALRSFLLPGDLLTRKVRRDEAEAWGDPSLAGTVARFSPEGVRVGDRLVAGGEVGLAAVQERERGGNQNRGAAGPQTRRALVLLDLFVSPRGGADHLAGEVARLDLDADPACRALDAAREALRDGPRTAAGERALSACLDFERAVGRAQHALRGQVVEVLRLASMGDHLEGPFGGDALTGGAEGQRRAFRVYRAGPKCLGSFARAHWIVQGAVRALRGVWSIDSEAGRAGVALLSLNHEHEDEGDGNPGTTHSQVVGDEGPEALAEAEELPRVLRRVLGQLGEGADPARAVLAGRAEIKRDRRGNIVAGPPPSLLARVADHMRRFLEPEVCRTERKHSPWRPVAPPEVRTTTAPPPRREPPDFGGWCALREEAGRVFG